MASNKKKHVVEKNQDNLGKEIISKGDSSKTENKVKIISEDQNSSKLEDI